MKNNTLLKAVDKFLKVRRNKWKVRAMASGIALALISVALFSFRMPAFTTEQDPSFVCGHHEHSAACYKTLDCGMEEGIFLHSADCLQDEQEPELACVLEETAGHTHDEDCATTSTLSCAAEEIDHTHGGGCYGEPIYNCAYASSGEEDDEHTCGSSCYDDGPLEC